MIRVFSGALSNYFEGMVPDEERFSYSSTWIDGNISYLRNGGVRPIEWDDDPERPFFSEYVDDDVFEAFILKAASARAGMPMLETLPKGFQSYDHPLVSKARESDDLVWNRTLFSVLFMPSHDIFSFLTYFPRGKQILSSSTAALSELLSRVNRSDWNADAYTAISWSDESKKEGNGIMMALSCETDDCPLPGDAAAKYVYSVLLRSLLFSNSGGTPIVIEKRGDEERYGRLQQKRRKA